MVGAREALAVGLVSAVVPTAEVVPRAVALAREHAPPHVAAQVKELARADGEASWLRLLELEKAAQRAGVLRRTPPASAG